MGDDFEGLETRVLDSRASLELPGTELVVVDGDDKGKNVRLEQGVARIGTGPGNDLMLSDDSVSRVHCEVVLRRGAILLRDRGSTNGTFVDGVRVAEAYLTPGAMIRVGGTTLTVESLDAPSLVELSPLDHFQGMVGSAPEMRRLYAILERIAPTDTTVLIEGETGTGKELVARAVHSASKRGDAAFVAIDCGAIPENLMESELFGHVRGAFSGAVQNRKGAFAEARGGTLFFDEVGELPMSLQPKLLRALETREVRPVGSDRVEKVDVRIVAATNRCLANSVNDGSFREDLFYRLAVIQVELPPLRQRREDIVALAAHFHEAFTGSDQGLPPGLADTLVQRAWPGNVRELRNFIQRVVSLGWKSPNEPASAGASGSDQLSPSLEQLVPVHLPLKEAREAWMEQFESVYVRTLLERTGGNVTRAAELAGVNRRFLQRMMARLGIRSKGA